MRVANKKIIHGEVPFDKVLAKLLCDFCNQAHTRSQGIAWETASVATPDWRETHWMGATAHTQSQSCLGLGWRVIRLPGVTHGISFLSMTRVRGINSISWPSRFIVTTPGRNIKS